jgi:hypothetical protein
VANEPKDVAANAWGTITYYPDWETLELTWRDTTRSMSDQGFKDTLQLLAEQGLEWRPSFMIIDATEFFHDVTTETLSWRDAHIVPCYNQAGIQKFAFLTTARMPTTVEKGAEPVPDGPANFPTGWFETKERMYAWLTS